MNVNGWLRLCLVLVACPVAGRAGDAWPVWRGDAGMTGVARGKLKLPLHEAWKFQAAKGDSDTAFATPVTDGKRVFFGDGDGVFRALDVKTGAVAWALPCPKKPPISAPAGIAEGRVVFADWDAIVHCCEADSGKELWKYEARSEVKAGINFFPLKGADGKVRTQVVVADFGGELYALDLATGGLTWRGDAGGPVMGAVSFSAEGLVFGGCNGEMIVTNPQDGKQLRKYELKSYLPNSVAIKDGTGYFANAANGKVEAVTVATAKSVWEFREKDLPNFTSPAVTADLVFFGGDDKRVRCVTRDKGDEKWAFRARDQVRSSPVVCGEFVVFGADDARLYVLDTLSGTQKWEYEVGEAIKGGSAVAEGRVFIGTQGGVVYGFESAP